MFHADVARLRASVIVNGAIRHPPARHGATLERGSAGPEYLSLNAPGDPLAAGPITAELGATCVARSVRCSARRKPWVARVAHRLVACGLALLALGCGDGLKVRGVLDRVVGESLTVELVEGKPTFGNEVTLVDAAGKVFADSELRRRLLSPRELSCVVPRGAQVGAARLLVPRQGTSASFSVPLTISRLVVALDEAGVVQTLPLPGSLVQGRRLEFEGTASQVSLSPDGGRLAVLTEPADGAPQGRLLLFALAGEPRLLHTVELDQRAVALAATDDGVLLATGTQLLYYRADRDNGLQAAWVLALTHIQGIAVAADARFAAVLMRCDSNGDTTVDADCVTRVPLDRDDTAQQPSALTILDAVASAQLIALRGDGLAAVVADTNVVYGVLFEGLAARVTAQPWNPSPAEPTSIDRAPSSIGEVFAISDRRNRVLVVGFNPQANNDLSIVRLSPVLDIAPVALGFGRGTDLLVGTREGGIYGLDIATGKSTDQPLLAGPGGPLRAMVAQH